MNIVDSAFWSLLSKFFNILVKAVSVIFIARILGPGEFGIFTLIISTAVLFSIFVDLGISPASARFLSENKWDNKSIVKMSSTLLLSLYLIFAGLFSFFGEYFFNLINASALNDYTVLFLVLVFFQIVHKYFLKCYEGLRRVDLSGKISFALSWAPWGLSLLFVLFLRGSAEYAIIGKILGTTLLVSGLIYFFKSIIQLKSTSEKKILPTKRLVSYAVPMVFTAVSFYIYTHSDILIIQAFLGEESVGIYGVAVRLLDTLHVPAAAIGSASAAFFVSKRESKPEELPKLFYNVSKWIFVIFFPLTIGLILTAHDLIPFLFGEEYAMAAIVLVIYAPTLLVKSFSGTYSLALDYLGYAKERAIAVSISAALNVGLNFILIPHYGLVGAAITTQLTYVPLVIWYTAKLKSIAGAKISILAGRLKNIIFSGIIMGLSILLFQFTFDLHILTIVLYGMTVYVLALFLLGVINKKDLHTVYKKIKK